MHNWLKIGRELLIKTKNDKKRKLFSYYKEENE